MVALWSLRGPTTTKDGREGSMTRGQVQWSVPLFAQVNRGFRARTHNPQAGGSSPPRPTRFRWSAPPLAPAELDDRVAMCLVRVNSPLSQSESSSGSLNPLQPHLTWGGAAVGPHVQRKSARSAATKPPWSSASGGPVPQESTHIFSPPSSTYSPSPLLFSARPPESVDTRRTRIRTLPGSCPGAALQPSAHDDSGRASGEGSAP